MRSCIPISVLVVLLFTWASAEDQTATVGGIKTYLIGSCALPDWVSFPDEAVSGFPLIIRATVVGERPSGDTEWVVDLAMDRNDVVSEMLVGFDSDDGDGYRVGVNGAWDDRSQAPGREPRVQLTQGEGVTHWFDVGRLARSKRLGLEWGRRNFEACRFPAERLVDQPLPVEGTWNVSLIRGQHHSLLQHTIRVREPNQDERKILEILNIEGAGLSWFPDVVFEEDQTPEDLVSRLPDTTRRTVRLIQVLRASHRSLQGGLDSIYLFADEDWAHLEPLVALIEYECLRDLGRIDSAETVHSRWKEDPGLRANFRLIDDGFGLVRRFRNASPSGYW